MSLDAWILALHVLSGFALVAGIVLFWVLIVAVRSADTPEQVLAMGPLSRLAEFAIGIGAIGTIGFGVWLAFSLEGYEILDGWIVAAIVLWAILMALGQRASAAYGPSVRQARELQVAGETGPSSVLLAINRTSTGVLLQALLSGVVLLILIACGGVGLYRLRTGKSGRLLKSALALSLVLVPAYLVAVWTMAGKVDY